MATRADGSVTIEVTLDDYKAEKGLHDLEDTSNGLEGSMMALNLALAAVSAGLLKAGINAVTASTEFESAFAKTQTIMDTNAVSAATMRQEVLALSQTSSMAATDVSEAVYQAISGSVDTADAVAFVAQANQLAAAGFTSLSNATDVLTTSLNAYGLDASAVAGISNVLIQTQNLGKTSVDELSASMGRAISTGSAYGVNLQNLSTAYVELTRGGIATAEATTYLSGMLNELGDAGSTVGGILQEKTGKSFGKLMADGWSLADVLKLLSDYADGDTEALMGLWSSQEAGKASNAIMTQGVSDFNSVLAQMNQEMSGLTGTTKSAYGTMTDTSAFIDQRLKNSVDNLGIAFGDGLRPMLDSVKEGLSGILEGLTQFVQDNPFVISAVSGLATAVVTLAAGYAALQIAQKAAIAVQALNAAMNSNPFILLATAVAGLVVGLGSYIAAANASCEAANALNTAVKESEAAYEEAMASAAGSAAVAQQYVNRLEALESQTSLTDAETEEYRETLEKLQILMPDLNLQIDEQTGMLESGAAALREQIDGWYELAVAQALQERYVAQMEAMVKAESDRATNLSKQKKLQSDIAVKQDLIIQNEKQYNAVEEKRNALQEEYSQMLETGDKNYDFAAAEEQLAIYDGQLQAISDSQEKLHQGIGDWKDDLDDLKDEEEELSEAIDENRATVEEGQRAYEDYMESLDQTEASAEDTGGRVNAAAAAIAEATGQWTASAENLSKAYEAAKLSARDSIDQQIGLWQKMDLETATSVSSIIETLDSQIAYMDTYAANLQLAAERGVSQGLLQALSDGTEESAAILAGLVDATDDQISEMNEKFAKVSEGKDDFAGALAEYNEVVLSKKEIMVDMAAQVGVDMSRQLTQGLLSGLSDYQAAWSRYANFPKSLPAWEAYAGGTSNAAAGYALVGELGPELVYFNGGERVLTAEETREALASVYPTAPQLRSFGPGMPAVAGRNTIVLHATVVSPVNVNGRELARGDRRIYGRTNGI